LPHTTLTLRTIAESSEGNQSALVADVIAAVSDVILSHQRWADVGLEWMAAFDSIDLAGIRKIVKTANVQPVRVGIATLICLELVKTLGPSKLPKPPKPIRVKQQRKPPRALTRVAGVEANVELGMKLVVLRAELKSNRAFGRAVRAQFDVDTMHAVECARVARAYGERPDIYRRLTRWCCYRRRPYPYRRPIGSPSGPSHSADRGRGECHGLRWTR
jgi:hypothetical protein